MRSRGPSRDNYIQISRAMAEVGGIPEDAYDDMITDDNERRKLQGYNINKEMKINTTRMSRSLCQLCRQLHKMF